MQSTRSKEDRENYSSDTDILIKDGKREIKAFVAGKDRIYAERT